MKKGGPSLGGRVAPWLTALALWCAAAHPAGAQVLPWSPSLVWASLGVDLDLAVRWFPVEGRSLREVRTNLRRVGPLGEDGRRVQGLTSYVMSATWSPYRDETGCRVSEARVKVFMTVLLPHWVNQPQATAGDAVVWDKVLARVTDHESAHRDLVLQAAYRMAQALAERRAPTCPSLVRRVDGLVQQVDMEVTAAHRHLDRTPVVWAIRDP